jgi:hypothetical protein
VVCDGKHLREKTCRCEASSGKPETVESERVQGYRIKRISACGGCLGDDRRRRTWQPAKSSGELANKH